MNTDLKILSFFSLVLQAICLSFAGGEGVVFCIRPFQSLNISCSNQECYLCNTFQYYLDNVNTTINEQENVTLLFMDGTHLINITYQSPVVLKAPFIQMKGESRKASIHCGLSEDSLGCFLYMENSSSISSAYLIDKIEMVRVWLIMGDITFLTYNIDIPSLPMDKRIDMASVKLFQSHIEFTYSMYTTVTVHIEFMTVELSAISVVNTESISYNNCSLSNSAVILSGVKNMLVTESFFQSSKLTVQNSNIVFSGLTKLVGSKGGYKSLISSYLSNITLSGTILFANNSGIRGGAIALHYSTLSIAANANVSFIDNFAYDKGGAIYIEPGITSRDGLQLISNIISGIDILDVLDIELTRTFSLFLGSPCFYQLLDCSANSDYVLKFSNNSAEYGGDDIYGASLRLSDLICPTFDIQSGHKCNLTLNRGTSDQALSSVSSDPLRVCLCEQGKPQCYGAYTQQVDQPQEVYPGEVLTLSAVLMGGDLKGMTTGTVFASCLSSPEPVIVKYSSQSITNQCSELNYSIYTNRTINNDTRLVLSLSASIMESDIAIATSFYTCNDYNNPFCSYFTPVFINITLLNGCPVGFSLTGDPPGCECYKILMDNGVECKVVNGTGYLSWNNSLWIGAQKVSITYNEYCPLNYCVTDTSKQINVSSLNNAQCAFNRAGRLCGGCEEGYSLAIGSSHCIHCPNNNNLALLIFFATAGFLLVLFISAFNLTVTKGMVNGLIFYANTVWIYQSIFISQSDDLSHVLMFLKTFIAWVNLDFGIETCFVHGLTAFLKTWLQFIFPLYIWTIAGLIILATKYSSRLTKLLGNTAVPVLNTLFLLSHAKLLRIVASSTEFSTLQVYSPFSTHVDKLITVWSVDGNLLYFGFPHILLFVAGLTTLLFLWLPYTLFLFLWQWLRRLSHVRFLKWVLRFHPVYDAYFAPLKHKHAYWFGSLLLVRGFLLVIFTSTFGVSNTFNLLILLIVGVVLLFYITLIQPYKSTAILFLQSSFLVNLIILSGFDIFAYTQRSKQSLKDLAFGISTGIAFLQFCIIVVYSRVGSRCTCRRRKAVKENYNDCDNGEPMAGVAVDSHSVSLRDSIFEESQKLLTDDP